MSTIKKPRITISQIYTILASMFVGCLLISNVLASKTFLIGPIMLPAAVILFPVVYVMNDIMAEIFGFQKARFAILLGFAINLLAVAFYSLAILLPAGIAEMGDAFALVLGNSWRILLGSFSAYLVGSLLNAFILVKMRDKGNKKHLMLRCIVSTIVGETIDAAIFITIAFIGIIPLPQLFIMIGAQAAFKIIYAVVAYPLAKVAIRKIEKLPTETQELIQE